jgi:hypothetical protein
MEFQEETMKWNVLCATAALTVSTLAIAAPARRAVIEKSPDVLRPEQLRKSATARFSPLATTLAPAAAAAAPTDAEVGDADSFGKNVTYLGLGQTLPIVLTDDCTGTDPTLERCIVQNAAPAPTTFDESGLGVMTLPAKATKDLICFSLTPFIDVSWANFTASQQNARFNATAVITIDNQVLDDPALIDPNTGAPFNGSITLGLSTWRNSHTMAVGETETQGLQQSRGCIAGIISRRQLVETYGLTDTIAKDFFRKPMTLHLGARGTLAMSQFTQYFYGVRLYGD